MPPPNNVIITATALQQVRADCLARAPEEACGLLICGLDTPEIHHIHPCPNIVDADKTTTFELDPAAHFAARRQYGADRIVGFYHSHPTGLCKPSEQDRLLITDPALIWMIVTPTDQATFLVHQQKQDFIPVPMQVKV